MTPSVRSSALSLRRRVWGGAAVMFAIAALVVGCLADARPSLAQGITFPDRPKPIPRSTQHAGGQDQMLVRAEVINYDYTNERVSASGNVQIYYGDSTLESDRVIYDQKTKRLHAEGNVRLTQADGTVTYGEIMDLSDDFRDGFVDSLRLDAPEQTRFAAARAERSSGNYTVFQSGVYTACEPCKDDPRKPPKWQVKAARIIHDEGEKMMYFEDARLEFFGTPLAYLPYFSAPDPTVKRKTGVLVPSVSSSNVYGYSVAVPYFWALAPDYDFTFTPMITTKQGALLQGEWRQRLVNGSYSIRASGIFQLDKRRIPNERPADAGLPRLARQHRDLGPVQPDAQMDLGLGRNATVGQDLFPGLRPAEVRADRQLAALDAGLCTVPTLSCGTRRSQLLRPPHPVLLCFLDR